MANLALYYLAGKGVKKDVARAIDLLEKAFDLGLARAGYNLGKMYYDGDGVPIDYNKAFEWYRRAAENGNKRSQFATGILYFLGDGVKKNNIKAYMWLKISGDEVDMVQKDLETVKAEMQPVEIAKAERLANEWLQSR